MPQVLSGGNYFVNLQRGVRKGDMEIIQWVLSLTINGVVIPTLFDFMVMS